MEGRIQVEHKMLLNRFIGFMPTPKPVIKSLKSEYSEGPLLLLNSEQEVEPKARALPLPEGEELNQIFREIERKLKVVS